MSAALLVPCFNAEVYLPNLAKQISKLEPNFDEVILVDDCSADGTASLAKELGLRIERLDKNLGPGGARNRLAEISSSEWIHFLDADDQIDAGYLKTVSEYATNGCDVVLSAADFIDESTGVLKKRWSFSADDFAKNPTEACFVTPVPLHCSLIRRAKFIEIGGFNEVHRCWEDGDLHLRLAASGAKFHVVDDVLATSPRHARGASADHLYCHQCRFDFVASYIRDQPLIRDEFLAKEAANLGYLFLAAGKPLRAWRAFSLINSLGCFPPSSENKVVGALLRRLPMNSAHMFSSSAKLSVGFMKRLCERREF